MDRRFVWAAGVAAVAVIVLCVRGCGGGPGGDVDVTGPVRPPSTAGVAPPTARPDDARDQSLRAAAATVEVYLDRFVKRDLPGADALWVDGAPPALSGEADLRVVERLRGLQITIEDVTAIDRLPMPEAVEVPLRLRASFYEGPMRYYRGAYRLRLVAPGQWRITSARLSSTDSPD